MLIEQLIAAAKELSREVGALEFAAPVGSPEKTHPKRPVQGFSCPRSEVSGRRL